MNLPSHNSETFRPSAEYSSQREHKFLREPTIATMKTALRRLFATALIAAAPTLATHAESPGLVDFGKFTAPGNGSEFVEVQVRSNLLNFAATLVEKEEPDAAKLLRSVQLVRVNVVGLTDANREEMQNRVKDIRQKLESSGWERNVNVQGKDGEDVGVYIQMQGSTALAGVAVTVIDRGNVVLVNLVGDIRPEQISALGEKLNIQPLKKIGEAVKQ